MGESYKPTRAQLETYVAAKPSAERVPGFFDDSGVFVRGPFYYAKLGKQVVGYDQGSYRKDGGVYAIREDALQGAQLFQAKASEMLAAGEFEGT